MIQLFKGDCLEVMKGIPNGSIDAIITDPPYGTTACKWDSVIDFQLMWEQLNRIIKANGAIVLFGSEPFSSALRMSNIKNYKYDWIWVKNTSGSFALAKKRPMQYHELISVFYKKQCVYNPKFGEYSEQSKKRNYNIKVVNEKFKTKTQGIKRTEINLDFKRGSYPKMIIEIKGANKTKRLHPTQKPVALMEYLIKTYTNENETVLDFTMGSGSTGVACVNTNRNFIGIEMDAGYFDIATKRINHKTELKLF
jgi:DNA modification methylase